jgi:hypothetical protein
MKPNEDVSQKEVLIRKPLDEKPVRGDEATRWKPGQSGNPGGRPKRTPLIDACREVLGEAVPNDSTGRTYARAIAEKLAVMALTGDIRAAGELADRAEGKARQSIAIETSALRQAFERMSREELEAYARDGKLPVWFSPERRDDETVH